MKNTITVLTIIALTLLAGCAAPDDKLLLTVDFQQNQTLRYKFVSSRDIEVDWAPDPEQNQDKKKQTTKKADKTTESFEMVIAYTPLNVDPYGLTTIKATCESVKTKRKIPTGRQGSTTADATQHLKGKSFNFTVAPNGKIEDYSQLDELIKQIGQKAFRSKTDRGRIKEPDMIGDFVLTQWFLWDAVSAIQNPTKGLNIGQTWSSKLSIPTPMVMRKARDVQYTLHEIRETEKGPLAVIKSTYSLSDSTPRTWPVPYTGRFQMSGRFGFLRGYKVLDLQGNGEELFNIDTGKTQQYKQNYKMTLTAGLPMSIDVNPKITINQKLTMTLLGNHK
ncbi:MAG: DUF6263 family protein [Planctomycetota bacterium]